MSSSRRAFLAQAAAAAVASAEVDPQREMIVALKSDLDALAAKWDVERAKIHTPEALRVRNEFVRARVREMLHVPAKRPAVVARVARTVERDGYRIENVLFQSAPGLWVTGNVYVPSGTGPWPAIVSPCGHYEASRMYPDYQFAYIDLVRSGFLVLAYDPTGQGERDEFPDLRSVDEHSMAGQLLLLFGDNLTQYLVRDGMCAVDYLLTRADVDKQRIGCAGHSGGGTLAMFLSCVDERIGCVVINEGGTFHRWPVTLKLDGSPPISDAEQNLFPAAIYGIDACDMHVAIAPRPLLALIEEYAPAFNETAAHIRARYQLLGVGDRFATEEAKAKHAWTAKLRLATVDWFCRNFYGRPGPSEEGVLEAEKPETLACSPAGEQRLFPIIRAKAEQLPARRRVTADQIRRVLRVTANLKPEPGASSGRVILFEDPACAPASTEGLDVVRFRVRGMATPPTQARPYAHLFNTETAMQYMAWYMDRELLGMRVADVLAHIDGRVQLIGTGVGAVAVLFAAALDPRVQAVVCHGGPLSYRALALSGKYTHGANVFVRGILRDFDLPDVAVLVAPRCRVVLVDPVDAMQQRVARSVAETAYGRSALVRDAASGYAACL